MKTDPWTADDVEQLERCLGTRTPRAIARIMGRSVAEVTRRILELVRGRREERWSRAELTRFKRLYGTRTDEDLMLLFGRDVGEIRRLAEEHRLCKDKAFVRRLRGASSTRMPRWNAGELEILRKSYAAQPNLEIARRLGRSVKSVTSRAHHLGLKKSPERLRLMGHENVSVRYMS